MDTFPEHISICGLHLWATTADHLITNRISSTRILHQIIALFLLSSLITPFNKLLGDDGESEFIVSTIILLDIPEDLLR